MKKLFTLLMMAAAMMTMVAVKQPGMNVLE